MEARSIDRNRSKSQLSVTRSLIIHYLTRVVNTLHRIKKLFVQYGLAYII